MRRFLASTASTLASSLRKIPARLLSGVIDAPSFVDRLIGALWICLVVLGTAVILNYVFSASLWRYLGDVVRGRAYASARSFRYFFAEIPRNLWIKLTSKRRRKKIDVVDDDEDATVCIVCLENKKRVLLYPCKHLCLCKDCSKSVTDQCPVCRTQIDKRDEIFI